MKYIIGFLIIGFLIGFILGIFGFMIYQGIKYVPVYTETQDLIECQEIKDSMNNIIQEQRELIVDMAEDCGR